MNWKKILFVTFVLVNLIKISIAQKGLGNTSGISITAAPSQVIDISGKVEKVLVEPCTETTGRYTTGSHLLIKYAGNGKEQLLNIHLGPASLLSELTDQFMPGQEIKLKVYHADGFKKNHYVAKSLFYDNELYELRDDFLRPFWANSGKGRMNNRR
ncbi:MAG: hypothetical protein V2I54_01880 [Bacteroidales bacterium]|jgi:hypothetical protein|nr:hypothetical protein [Bacteroidales bacterium]